MGLKTTVKQGKALHRLAVPDAQRQSLAQRVGHAIGHDEPWSSAFQDLLTILGDGLSDVNSNLDVTSCQLAAMRRNWQSDTDGLRRRIIDLRTLYDWPALQAAIRVCPGASEECTFKLNDLFNLLDMHGQSGHGFPKGLQETAADEFLTPQEVLGARNALKMLLQAMLYVDWQRGRLDRRNELNHHYEFAKAIGQRMQRQGVRYPSNGCFDSRAFYMGDVSFASLNYDPVALWCQFVANRDLNKSPSVPHVGSPARKLQLFHDLGHFVAGSHVHEKPSCGPKTPWHPMNESSAQRLNDPDHGSHDRVRVTKFLFPHGCLWWRECPNCGKLSSYMGHSWDRDSEDLIPPPPFRGFVQPDMLQRRLNNERFLRKERDAWTRGEVDARACVHCCTLTYAHHTQTRMQSNFKGAAPPFLEEINRDMRVAVQNAGHIILMGYSLPPDDVEFRAFFAARRRLNDNVKCSVVVGTGGDDRWLGPAEWRGRLSAMKKGERKTLEAARDLFGADNVRFFGRGIPQVFLEDGRVTTSAVKRLLTWEAH